MVQDGGRWRLQLRAGGVGVVKDGGGGPPRRRALRPRRRPLRPKKGGVEARQSRLVLPAILLCFIHGPTHVTQTDVWVSRGDTLSLFKRRGNPCSGNRYG